MKSETAVNGNGFIVVPRWFASFLSFMVSVGLVGAVVWAWGISSDVAAIKAEVKANSDVRASELADIRRRLDRHDELFDRIFHKGQP